MPDFVINEKIITLSKSQLLLTKAIANLGFVTKSQIDLLYSIINKKNMNLAQRILREKLIRTTILKAIPAASQRNSIDSPAYVIGKNGREIMKKCEVRVRDERSFSINSHNLQSNEVLIQALFAAAFKPNALGKNNTSLVFESEKISARSALNQSFSLKNRTNTIANKRKKAKYQIVSRLDLGKIQKISSQSTKAQVISNGLLISGVKREENFRTFSGFLPESFRIFSGKYPDGLAFFKAITEIIRNPSGICTEDVRTFAGKFTDDLTFSKSITETIRNLSGFLTEFFRTFAGRSHFLFWDMNNLPKMFVKPISLQPYQANDILDQIEQTYLQQTSIQNKFDIAKFDIRPFNQQFNSSNSQNKKFPFEADTMITFMRGDRLQRVFIELDNRTEGSKTQIQKIANYIAYAGEHPQDDILLAIVSTDGSLASKKVNGFNYPDLHLANLVSKVLRTTIGKRKIYPDGTFTEPPKLKRDLYDNRNNLTIIFAGVSEAPARIAEFILNANHNFEYFTSAMHLAQKISQKTSWVLNFEPVIPMKKALQNTQNFFDNGQNLYHYQIPKIMGFYHYTSTETNLNLIQPVIAGDEYDLDTPDEVMKVMEQYDNRQSLNDNQIIPPVVIYPIRERKRHAIALPEFKNIVNWNENFIAGQIYYYQPRLGLDNNPYLLMEL